MNNQVTHSSDITDEDEFELPLAGDSFPLERYKPLSILGKGAAGSVYLCRDRLLSKKVAVKTLHRLDRNDLLSFQDEARATSRLNHANIITVLDFGATDYGTPYMVLEYVPGISLQKCIEKYGALNPDMLKPIFMKVAEALHYAHDNRVYHRDLKPSNILIMEEDTGLAVKLIDFGVARIKEQTGDITEYQNKTLAGTPSYMSPDPVLGNSFDQRSEVYSLGCVMFEAVSGKPPFRADTAIETIAMHANAQPPDLRALHQDISESLASIIEKCLQKRPDDRYHSMKELAAALETIDEDSSGMSPEPRLAVRSNLATALLTVSALVFIGAVAWSIWPHAGAIKNGGISRRSTASDGRVFPETNTSYTYRADGAIDGDLKILLNKRVDQLNLVSCTISGDGLEYINSNLKVLHFKESTIESSFVNNLQQFSRLRAIDFSLSTFEPGALAALKRLPGLKRLVLTATDITDEDMQTVSELPALHSLTVSDCEKLTETSLVYLKNLETLTFLSIPPHCLTKSSIEAINSYPQQHTLAIALADNTYHGRLAANVAQNLEGLAVDSLEIKKLSINTSAAKALSGLRSVKSLKLEMTPIQERDLALIRDSLNRRKIRLTYIPAVLRNDDFGNFEDSYQHLFEQPE